jgi:PAS domain S-box-containing protein
MSHHHWNPPMDPDNGEAEYSRSWRLMPDMLLVFDVPSGRFEHVNPAWCRVLGWDAAEVVGRPYTQFVHPEDLAASETAHRQLIAGEPILAFENRYRHKDGSYRWLSWAAVPDGTKVFARALDITEQKAAMLELAARTMEREQVWELSRDLLLVADARGRWLSVNPAVTRMLGWHDSELLGRTSEWLEHPDDRAQTRQEIARLAAGETTLAFENRFRAKDGRYHRLSWTATQHNGLFFCVARDVSEIDAARAAPPAP